jgi:hypothetical protein
MPTNDTECNTYDTTLHKVYNEGYKEGSNEYRHREYHTGYKHGYRDAGEDRYWFGWYSGLMMGTLTAIVGGLIIATTTKKNRLTPF